MAKTDNIHVRVTETEKQLYAQMSVEEGFPSLSAYVKDLLDKEILKKMKKDLKN